MNKKIFVASLSLQLLLTGCSTFTPTTIQANNCCELFDSNFQWYKAANTSREYWGVPISVQMAVIFQESSFKHNAIPDREYLLGFIPWKRKSSAYGYGQVLKSTWQSYEKSRPGFIFSRSRNNFNDVTDFVGWYLNTASKRLNIPMSDAYNMYLVYHEGVGGYKRGSFNNKDGLKKIARKVDRRAKMYRLQLSKCQSNLLYKHPLYAIFH